MLTKERHLLGRDVVVAGGKLRVATRRKAIFRDRIVRIISRDNPRASAGRPSLPVLVTGTDLMARASAGLCTPGPAPTYY